jgi:hypothetical protein
MSDVSLTETWYLGGYEIGASLANLSSELSSRAGISTYLNPWVLSHCQGEVDTTEIEEAYHNIDLLAIDLLAPIVEGYERDVPRQRRIKRGLFLCKRRVEQLHWVLENFGSGRNLLITKNSIGVGPLLAEKGDTIFCLNGVDNPFVLRKKGSEYAVIGKCLLQQVPDLNDHKSKCGDGYVRGCKCHACGQYWNWEATCKQSRVQEVVLI